MASSKDPTEAMRKMAAAFPDVVSGTSCNQMSFKVGKGSFLFVGPGAKGIGFKAMFKLDHSIEQARALAAESPDRFDVGSTGWVTARFSKESPLPVSIWKKWLKESHKLCESGGRKSATKKKSVAKSTGKKKVAKKKSGTKKSRAKKKG